MRLPKTFSLDLKFLKAIEEQTKGRDANRFVEELLERGGLFGTATPKDAAKVQDCDARQKEVIDAVRKMSQKASKWSEEKADHLLTAALETGIFSSKQEFIAALKKANGVA